MATYHWQCLAGQVAALTLTLGGIASVGNAQGNAETIFRDARNYTVRVRTQISTPFIDDERGSFSGAGFLVDSTRGWVVTNAHVVGQSPSDVAIAFAGGTFVTARKLYVDSFTDMAVIEVPVDQRRHPAAPLDCNNPPEIGEAIGVFGHPLGMPFTGSRGIISGRTDLLVNDLLQIDATVDPGNSGGPVIALRDSRIVGIATAGAAGEKTDRLNFATPMRDVCRIVDLLRQGISPEPPQMEFSLVIDEDGRRTLRVGVSHEATRWPFQPGDLIVSIGREATPVATVTEFVTAMRGRSGGVPIRVTRGEREVEIVARPRVEPSVIARRGVSIDGALIASHTFEDGSALSDAAQLVVQSVEPGSVAEALDLNRMDLIESINGHRVDSFSDLLSLVHRHKHGEPLTIAYRRMSRSANQWYEYHARELPGDELRVIEPEAQLLSSAP